MMSLYIALGALLLLVVLVATWSMKLMFRLTIITILSLTSLGLYWYWGSADALALFYQSERQAQQVKKTLAKFNNPEEIIQTLKAKVMADSNNPKGWFLLGRLYFSNQQYNEALSAFEKSLALENTTQTQFQIAQTRYFNNKQRLDITARAILDEILKQNPNQADALNLMAVNAYQQKQYEKAIRNWRELLKQYPTESESAQLLMQAIMQAKSLQRSAPNNRPAST